MSAEEQIEITSPTLLMTLLLLYKSQLHGYQLISELKKVFGKEPSRGAIYANLERLLTQGYVELAETGKRKKKVYRLTEKGRELVEEIIDRMSSILGAILEERINVCVNCGCKIYDAGHKEVIGDREYLFCCVHCANNYLKNTGGERKW